MSQFRQTTRKNINPQLFNQVQVDQPILIVEDQGSLSKMLSDLLVEQWGCEVHIAESYAEAKAQLSRHRHEYLVAICDLNLPDAPNAEIISLVKKAKVSMIALSGSFGEKVREEMVDKGVIDYIIKDSINAYQYLVNLVGRLYKNQTTKILIAEDSVSAREMLKHMLDMQKFQTFTADNGVQAMEIMEQNPDIKLLVTDYSMPEMDGFTLTLSARETYPTDKLAIIGVSAMNQSDLGAQFIKNGANDFLLKPYSYEELLCRINQNIDMLEYVECIQNAANRDFLTRLYNRRYFFQVGKTIYDEAKENHTALTACMIDIDHFKQVNDQYGHDSWDDVLIHFSKQLEHHFNQHLVARLGGEEFAILFENGDERDIFQELDSFRQTISQVPVISNGQSIPISVSIGVGSTYKENLDAMLKVADENLYYAKHHGRNQVIA